MIIGGNRIVVNVINQKLGGSIMELRGRGMNEWLSL